MDCDKADTRAKKKAVVQAKEKKSKVRATAKPTKAAAKRKRDLDDDKQDVSANHEQSLVG